MKTWPVIILTLLFLAIIAMTVPAFAGQTANQSSVVVPKYNLATEATFKGTVEEVRDRQCPVSGGMGSHVVLRLADGKTIEVHLATTKFVNTYDLVFHKGDVIEVVGSKVTFEGVETIFARQVTRGQDTFLFRDKNGKPVW